MSLSSPVQASLEEEVYLVESLVEEQMVKFES